MDWINIKDKQPPEGRGVLVANNKIVTLAIFTQTGESDVEWQFDPDETTHWAELPELPKKIEKE